MKKVLFAAVLLVAAFAATSSFAQSSFTLRARVPFAFSANGHEFSAGAYEVRTINTDVIHLRNIKTGEGGMVMLVSNDRSLGVTGGTPNLRFLVSGDHGYLLSVTESGGTRYNVPVAKRSLAASRKPESKNVVVALK